MVKHVPGENSFLEMSSAELDLLLGESLVAEEFGAKELSAVEKQAAARRWFASHLHDFQQVLCVSPVRTSIFSADKADRNTLFAAVVDTLGKVTGLPVPVAVLSARIIHYGLDKLCAETEDPES